ncbi:hypothetical protein L7F22_052576 [Adiantum nelumboides]|nr:hypothetical protein [Adiantum nelumboides]
MQANGLAFAKRWYIYHRARPLTELHRRIGETHSNRGITRVNLSMGDRGRLVPIWAQPLCCSDNMQCSDGECEYLHVSDEQRSKGCILPHGRGKLVVCAGPERSGSTWLFNALRFLLEGTDHQRVHSYWINHITQTKLVKRGVGLESDAAHILIKTHKWSNDWDLTSADLIVVTERDICGVVNSYLRVGWKPKDMGYLKNFMKCYLEDHHHWKAVAHTVIKYEDISDVGGRELLRLLELLDLLQYDGMDLAEISTKIKNLPVPSYDLRDEKNTELMVLLWLKYADLMEEKNSNLMVLLWLKNTALKDEKNADMMILLWLKNAALRDEKNADLLVLLWLKNADLMDEKNADTMAGLSLGTLSILVCGRDLVKLFFMHVVDEPDLVDQEYPDDTLLFSRYTLDLLDTICHVLDVYFVANGACINWLKSYGILVGSEEIPTWGRDGFTWLWHGIHVNTWGSTWVWMSPRSTVLLSHAVDAQEVMLLVLTASFHGGPCSSGQPGALNVGMVLCFMLDTAQRR